MKLLRAPLAGALLSFAFAGTAWAGPDLTAEMYSRSDRLGGSAYFSVGTVLLEFAIKNIGDAPAPGALVRRKSGYTVDVVLSRDPTVRRGLARYSASFTDDVLLRSGHYSDTLDLAPGAEQRFSGPLRYRGSPASPYNYLEFPLPSGLSPGGYFVCVNVDPENRVAESNELNNTTCSAIEIRSYVFPKARKAP